MFPRLGAVMGARLRSLPRCWSDADLHQLVTCSKIVFQSSWDVDQTRCAFGKPTGQISCLFQVACPALAVLGKKMPDRNSLLPSPKAAIQEYKTFRE